METSFARPELLTAAEKVRRGLRAAIMSGALAAGAPIRQEELAAQYQVSRMPVREALRQLEAEGLVLIYPNRGAFVATLDARAIREIYEIRLLLECDALRRAVPVLKPTVIDHAADILDQLDAAQESDNWGTLDEAFHASIYAPVDRPRLLDLITTLRRQVTQFYYVVTPLERYRARSQEEHRQILAACAAGDVAGAVAALEVHLHNSADAAIAAIPQPQAALEDRL